VPEVQPVTGRARISEIAYGFMASQALFAALEIDLFGHLTGGPVPVDEIATATGIARNRLTTLLHALASVGLVVEAGGRYTNSPAGARYLVRSSPQAFGEYIRLQVARQIYPAMLHLSSGLAGTGFAFGTFSDLLSRPDEARTFTQAQHAGSLAAARVLAGRIPLDGARRLLDVGGGSGAFTIAFCDRNPGLRATVLDFPAVADIAREYIDETGLAERVELLRGDAVHGGWPSGQDVVVLSYLLSAIGDRDIDTVLAEAHRCLDDGGLLVVHDFMLDDDGPGPAPAALWFLQYVSYRGDSVSFSAHDLITRLRLAGFEPDDGTVLIPEITKVIIARKVKRP
jgi:ubiquinone/menaquinone biosynthesis C-methylase UbiE